MTKTHEDNQARPQLNTWVFIHDAFMRVWVMLCGIMIMAIVMMLDDSYKLNFATCWFWGISFGMTFLAGAQEARIEMGNQLHDSILDAFKNRVECEMDAMMYLNEHMMLIKKLIASGSTASVEALDRLIDYTGNERNNRLADLHEITSIQEFISDKG